MAGQGPIYTDNFVSNADILVYSGPTVTLGVVTMEPITTMVTVECFRVPKTVEWAYVVVANKALYNSGLAVNFELHKSEEDTLVNKVLELAGIVINKPGLMQLASQKDATEIQIQNAS